MMPVKVTLDSGMKQLYVDGGVVVNYPLHVFDGRLIYLANNSMVLSCFYQTISHICCKYLHIQYVF